jgi:serine phosphatase RsbU (regulator of sigma subunit)
MRVISILIFILLILAPPSAVSAQSDDVFTLTPDSFRDGRSVGLDRQQWRFRPGDELAWADPQFDDSSWETVPDTSFDVDELHSLGWRGIGWFRLRLRIAPELVGEPLSIALQQIGAAEIYLNGRLIRRFGRIGASAEEEQTFNPRQMPTVVVFDNREVHTIAIRQSVMDLSDTNSGWGRWLARVDEDMDIGLRIAQANDAVLGREQFLKPIITRQSIFIGVTVAIGLLHLLLFFFYPRQRANLFFTLFTFGFALNVFFSTLNATANYGVRADAIIDNFQMLVIGVIVFSFVSFLYAALLDKFPKHFWIVFAAWTLLALWMLVFPNSRLEFYADIFIVGFVIVESVRIIARALLRRADGAWIVGLGVFLLMLAPTTDTLEMMDVIDMPSFWNNMLDQISLGGIVVSISAYLARNFARTNRNLEAKLVEVETLSAERLEQERTAAELRLQNEQERAQRALVEQELALAASIQQELFPEKMPEVEGYDIAARTRPARVCGGDYYDAVTLSNGDGDGRNAYLFCVADVSGKGLPASLLMSNMQATLRALAGRNVSLVELATETNELLHATSPSNKFVTAILLEIDPASGRGRYVNAGHNECVLMRRGGGEIELLKSTGLPLGMLPGMSYEEKEFQLQPGDLLALYSDGVPEAYDENEQEWGEERLCDLLRKVNGEPAESIVNKIFEEIDRFAGAAPQHDDITLFIFKPTNNTESELLV